MKERGSEAERGCLSVCSGLKDIEEAQLYIDEGMKQKNKNRRKTGRRKLIRKIEMGGNGYSEGCMCTLTRTKECCRSICMKK